MRHVTIVTFPSKLLCVFRPVQAASMTKRLHYQENFPVAKVSRSQHAMGRQLLLMERYG